ncbi:MAG: hypothetical protein ACLS6Q_02470 [Christensenellaceae bacterium]
MKKNKIKSAINALQALAFPSQEIFMNFVIARYSRPFWRKKALLKPFKHLQTVYL